MHSSRNPPGGNLSSLDNLLSLDGGGVIGLSSLLLLAEIMKRLEGRDKPLYPADYFDLIGGTGTGGIIAIMLGRLRLSVDEAIVAYTKLMSKYFAASGWEGTQPRGAPESMVYDTTRSQCTLRDGPQVTIGVFRPYSKEPPAAGKAYVREIRVWSSLQHDHILPFLGSVMPDQQLVSVLHSSWKTTAPTRRDEYGVMSGANAAHPTRPPSQCPLTSPLYPTPAITWFNVGLESLPTNFKQMGPASGLSCICSSANSILHTAQFAQESNLFDPEPPIDFFDIPLNSIPPHAIPPGLPHGYSSVITPEITFDTSAFPTQTGQYQVQLDYTYSPQDHILSDTPLLTDTPGTGVWPATVSYVTPTQPHHGVSALLYQLRDELNLLLGPPIHSVMFTNPSPPDPVIRARSDPVDQPPNHLPPLVLNPEAQHHELGNFPASGAHPLLNPPESPLASTSQTQMAQPQQQPASGSESSSVSGISPAHGATEDPENYCTICGKSFRRPYVFEDHMRAHTGEASPYRCEFEGCAKVYHNRSNLLRHLKAHSRVGKTRNRPQKNDEQVPDDTSEQRPAAGPSTRNAHNSISTHRPDQVVPGSGNARFRPYETPDSVRHKINKRKK